MDDPCADCPDVVPGEPCCILTCRGCPDRHLGACCSIVPRVPLRLPRRLRRDPGRLALLDLLDGEPEGCEVPQLLHWAPR